MSNLVVGSTLKEFFRMLVGEAFSRQMVSLGEVTEFYVVNLYRNATPVDVVTLMDQLNRDGGLEKVGGPSYIADIAGAVPTSANV